MTDVAIDNIQLFLSYKVNIERYQSEFCCFPEGWKVDNLMFTLYESNECFIIPKLLYFKHISLSTKYRQLIRHKLYTYEAFSVTYKSWKRQYITKKNQHYFVHNYLRRLVKESLTHLNTLLWDYWVLRSQNVTVPVLYANSKKSNPRSVFNICSWTIVK